MAVLMGTAENAIIQYGDVRAIHGWLDAGDDDLLICFCTPARGLLFKVIYRYSRPDVQVQREQACGFLAEIVYGSRDFITQLALPPLPQGTHGFLLTSAGAASGVIQCTGMARSALMLHPVAAR